MKETAGQVLPLEHNLRSIKRLALQELRQLYHITGAWQFHNQDPEMRALFEEGMVEL